MASNSTNSGPAPTPQSAGNGNSGKAHTPKAKVEIRKAKLTQVKRSRVKGQYYNIGSGASGNRMLKDRLMVATRPELISVMDFFPLYDGSETKSKGGELFYLRKSLRDASLDSLEETLSSVETDFPDAFSSAFIQYESGLASAKAELSLLKLMFLMRKYAEHCTSFSELMNLYTYPEDYDFSYIGGSEDSVETFMERIMRIKPQGDAYFNYGTIPFLQLVADLSYASTFGTPDLTNVPMREPNKNYITTNINRQKVRLKSVSARCTRVSRDLTASNEISRIINGASNLNTDLQVILEEEFPECLTSKTELTQTIFGNLAGWDKWKKSRRNINKFTNEANDKFWYLNQFNNKKNGLMGAIKNTANAEEREARRKDNSIRKEDILYAEKLSATLKKKGGSTKTYDSMKLVVEDAFSMDNILDFVEFDQVTNDLIEACEDFAVGHKSLYRLLDRANVQDDEVPPGIILLANEPPLSPASIFGTVLSVFNTRFCSKISDAINSPIRRVHSALGEDGDPSVDTTDMDNYLRTQAYVYLKQYPDSAKDIVKATIKDFLSGWLTASGIPDEITEAVEYDDDGVTITIEEVLGFEATAYVDPFTEDSTNPGSGCRVLSKIGSMRTKCNNMVQLEKYEKSWIAGMMYFEGCQDQGVNYTQGGGWGQVYSTWFCRFTPADSGAYTEYTQVKFVTAELMDCFIEIIRRLFKTSYDIEAVADGDPVFPSLEQIPQPYGHDKGNNFPWSSSHYAAYDTEYWVPTLKIFIENICRSGDYTTYYAAQKIEELSGTIMGILYSIMNECYGNLELKCAKTGKYTGPGDLLMFYRVITAMTDGHRTAEKNTQFLKNQSVLIDYVLGKTPDQLVDANKTWPSSVVFNAQQPLDNMFDFLKNNMLELLEQDKSLGLGFDIIESYGARVKSYADAAMDALTTGEDSEQGSVQEYITQLIKSGDAGADVVQNINPQQLALKVISLERQMGNPDAAYVSNMDIITDNDISALEILMQNTSLVGSEGDNIRVIAVGLPAGLFNLSDIDDNFSLMVTNVDIEYADLVFKKKILNFSPSLFILKDNLDIDYDGITTFSDLVKLITYTRVAFSVDEGSSADPQLTLVETNEEESVPEDLEGLDIYANHLISYLLEIYYRMMVGIRMNEDSFPSTSDSIGLGVNEYATDLSSAVTSFYADIQSDAGDSFGSILTAGESIVQDYQEFVSEFSSEIQTGEFTDLDAEMLSQFRNSLSSRLFSAEDMRDKIISAKVFDRVFMLLIDPDEFVIANEDNVGDNDPYTKKAVLDQYLEKGIVEEVGTDDDGDPIYKLAPRVQNEGMMAFNKLFVNVGTETENSNDQVNM